jgi:hypothetical protein
MVCGSLTVSNTNGRTVFKAMGSQRHWFSVSAFSPTLAAICTTGRCQRTLLTSEVRV